MYSSIALAETLGNGGRLPFVYALEAQQGGGTCAEPSFFPIRITTDTDLRLARYFKMSDGFSCAYRPDFELMQRRREIGDKLKAIRPRAA
jgi:hypothetical protein